MSIDRAGGEFSGKNCWSLTWLDTGQYLPGSDGCIVGTGKKRRQGWYQVPESQNIDSQEIP